MSPILTGVTGVIISGRAGQVGRVGRRAGAAWPALAQPACPTCRDYATDSVAARCGAVRACAGSCLDEAGEQRMRMRRLRLELRMELHRQIPGMAGELGDLDELAVGRSARDPQAVFGERALVEAVELVAMAMALVNQVGAVDAVGERAGRELAGVAAEPHRAAELVDAEQVAQLVDHLGGRLGIALGRIGVGEAGDVARVLDGRPLEAVADPEVGDAALARDLRGLHHPARAAIAEAAGHENAVRGVEQRPRRSVPRALRPRST